MTNNRLTVVGVGQFFRLLFTLMCAVFACDGAPACNACHPKEVEGYSHYSMAHSLRQPSHEPSGAFQNEFGTKFKVYANASGIWQRMENTGEASEYRVEYVIGSGKHALGYLVRVGDHLFQSPIGYYTDRHAYAMAPGYEKHAEADFTRPVTEECLFCHSGKALHIAGTVAGYKTPAFEEEAISCERCHGPTGEHLKRPVPGSIVNPAKLQGAARDSVCEQCHLFGVARIPNTGKRVEDFRPGMPLEEVFTVYSSPAAASSAFRVISHSEQLRASACARNSAGKLWCGTCHDLHNKPAVPIAYYRTRCLACHAGKLPHAHPAANSDCVSCHMPSRQTFDGAHTVFTDHRIQRRATVESPPPDVVPPNPSELVAWRNPDSGLTTRNLALAYIEAGEQHNWASWIVSGYRLLTEVQTAFPRDPAVLKAFGSALLQANQPQEAKIAFDRVLELQPGEAVNEEDAGRADLASGNLDQAAIHLERAVSIDPLMLSSVGLLDQIYRKQGDRAKRAALGDRLRLAIGKTASSEGSH